jgi:hypothetical protein
MTLTPPQQASAWRTEHVCTIEARTTFTVVGTDGGDSHAVQALIHAPTGRNQAQLALVPAPPA